MAGGSRMPGDSAVRRMHRLVPEDLRAEIEAAIVDRPVGRASWAAIHRHYQLRDKFGIGLSAFRKYARRVEWMRRQQAAGTIATGICEAAAGEEDVGDGETEEVLQSRGRLLLLQKLIGQLSSGDLSNAELARLAGAFVAQGRLALAREKRAREEEARSRAEAGRGRSDEELAGLVREVYGAEVGSED